MPSLGCLWIVQASGSGNLADRDLILLGIQPKTRGVWNLSLRQVGRNLLLGELGFDQIFGVDGDVVDQFEVHQSANVVGVVLALQRL